MADLDQVPETTPVAGSRDDELAKPLAQRTVGPVVIKLGNFLKRFTPVGYADEAKVKLVRAGRRGPDAADRFLAIRVVTVVAAPPLAGASEAIPAPTPTPT